MPDTFDLMVAPNGARLTQKDHPRLPITAVELAQTAKACADAGATSIHAHVRDHRGKHSLDPTLYADAVREIAKQTSIPVQFSTEAAGIFDVPAQRHCLENPATRDASVSLREIARAPDSFSDTYRAADEKGVDIQHILYDTTDLQELLDRFDTGEIPQQSRRAIFVLGRYTPGQVSTPSDLDPFLKTMGAAALNWSVCAFGQNEQACLMAALQAGGNARIGFENNRLTPDGTIFPDNAASVAAFVELADKAGFSPKVQTP